MDIARLKAFEEVLHILATSSRYSLAPRWLYERALFTADMHQYPFAD